MCVLCVQLPEVINARLLSVYTAKLLLKDTNCMEFCLSLLQALLKNQSSLLPAEVRTSGHVGSMNWECVVAHKMSTGRGFTSKRAPCSE